MGYKMTFTKFTPTNMRVVLKGIIPTTVGERKNKAEMPEPLCYETKEAIIIPPATDKIDSESSQLYSIAEMIGFAQKEIKANLDAGKILLIPIAEENPQFSNITETITNRLPANVKCFF